MRSSSRRNSTRFAVAPFAPTKITQRPKYGFVSQVCAYADLLGCSGDRVLRCNCWPPATPRRLPSNEFSALASRSPSSESSSESKPSAIRHTTVSWGGFPWRPRRTSSSGAPRPTGRPSSPLTGPLPAQLSVLGHTHSCLARRELGGLLPPAVPQPLVRAGGLRGRCRLRSLDLAWRCYVAWVRPPQRATRRQDHQALRDHSQAPRRIRLASRRLQVQGALRSPRRRSRRSLPPRRGKFHIPGCLLAHLC